MEPPAYEDHTRFYYQDPNVAGAYAARQSFLGSPAEFAIGTGERVAVRRALHRLTRGELKEVLDVPSGTGKLTRDISGISTRYVACDISSAMLRYVSPSVPRCRGDATRLPFADNSVDVVVCLRLLHRVPAEVAEEVINEALRVARRGCVISYASYPALRSIHRLLQAVFRRRSNWTRPVTKSEFRSSVSRTDAVVVSDVSITLGLTAERVAAICRVEMESSGA